jgi:DNA-binding LytR/AlgR family response regulator
MVPVEEVLYFEAADKYLRVLTASAEYLIRTPLKELLAQLDPQVFWQIHRGTIVNLRAIARVDRDWRGEPVVVLRAGERKLPVSRTFAPRFKTM